MLNIVRLGSPVLKDKATPVEFVGRKEKRLLNEMAETMYARSGVGLAAPQVNESLRIIVVDDGAGLIEMINPEILESSGEAVDEEGCLSYPGFCGVVKRADRITVQGMDRNMRTVRLSCDGFLARIFQHEIDHLDGIMFTDIASSIKEIKPEDED